MNTRSFKITYASGNTEVVTTDAVDAADQINRTFGLTPEEAADHGCSVELIGDIEAEPEAVLQELLQEQLDHPDTAQVPVDTAKVEQFDGPVHITRGVAETSQAGDSAGPTESQGDEEKPSKSKKKSS